MSKVKTSIAQVKENYQLRASFFYDRLRSNEYFDLIARVRRYNREKGSSLKWDQSLRKEYGISEDAWKVITRKKIPPVLVFAHPDTLGSHPEFLKYYRSVAMLPQKGLTTITGITNVSSIEKSKAKKLTDKVISNLVFSINEVTSLVVSLNKDINATKIAGMMYATAGTNIDGSWRNQIGAEGERVVRAIVLNGLDQHRDIAKIVSKDGKKSLPVADALQSLENVRRVDLINGYTVLFGSEPDITLLNGAEIVGIVEVKAGIDPAGALERLGAVYKSFDNTKAQFPDATTILVASGLTPESRSRLLNAESVNYVYETLALTASDSERRKFVNKIRTALKLKGARDRAM